MTAARLMAIFFAAWAILNIAAAIVVTLLWLAVGSLILLFPLSYSIISAVLSGTAAWYLWRNK